MRLVSLLAVTTFALAGCGSGLDAGAADRIVIDASETQAATSGTVTVIEPSDRVDTVLLEGDTLSGNRISTNDLVGDVVVINAWASWCAPCRDELPELVAAHDATVGEGVTFVGLNVNDNSSAAMEFAQAIPYDSIIDATASLQAQIPEIPAKALPVTVVLDKQGRVAVRIIGVIPSGSLEPLVKNLLNES